jgi:hypothetical protein
MYGKIIQYRNKVMKKGRILLGIICKAVTTLRIETGIINNKM